MGTTVELLLEQGSADAWEAFDVVEAEFLRLESLMSRFREDSELSRLNRAGHARVGADLRCVVRLGLEARERTGGRFDPTVHDALVGIGYERSIENVPLDGPSIVLSLTPCGGHVEIDDVAETITIAPNARLDLGGIAKGYAVDRAAELLALSGACLVNAGGDVAVRGQLAGDPWPVAVDVPDSALTLGLVRGALATSGSNERQWRRGHVELHHLVDPATGLPSASDLRQVTAFADSAVDAEIEAKSLFLAGEESAVAEATARSIPCVLVTREGRVRMAGGLA